MIPTFVIIIVSLIWGSTFWIIKDALKHIPVTVLLSYRFLLAAFILLPWVYKYRQGLKQNLKAGLCMGIVLWLAYFLQFRGLTLTSATNSGFITGLYLIFVPFFQYFFYQKKLNLLQGVSVFITLFGLWFLTRGIQGVNLGDILTLLSAICIGLQIILVDRFTRAGTHLVLVNFIQFLLVGVLSLGTLLLTGESFWVGEKVSLIVILYLSLIATVACFFGQLWAQKFLSPIKASLLFMIEPLSAAVFAWTIGDEKATFQSVCGGGILLFGIALTDISEYILKWIKNR